MDSKQKTMLKALIYERLNLVYKTHLLHEGKMVEEKNLDSLISNKIILERAKRRNAERVLRKSILTHDININKTESRNTILLNEVKKGIANLNKDIKEKIQKIKKYEKEITLIDTENAELFRELTDAKIIDFIENCTDLYSDFTDLFVKAYFSSSEKVELKASILKKVNGVFEKYD